MILHHRLKVKKMLEVCSQVSFNDYSRYVFFFCDLSNVQAINIFVFLPYLAKKASGRRGNKGINGTKLIDDIILF